MGKFLKSKCGRKETFYKPSKPLLYYIWSQMHCKKCTQPHICQLGEPCTSQLYCLIKLNCFLLIVCLCGSMIQLYKSHVNPLACWLFAVSLLCCRWFWNLNCVCLSEMLVKGCILYVKLWWRVCTYILCFNPSLSLKPCLVVGDLQTPLCSLKDIASFLISCL